MTHEIGNEVDKSTSVHPGTFHCKPEQPDHLSEWKRGMELTGRKGNHRGFCQMIRV